MVEEKKIPDGYKETEVGVIPVEWETHLLEDEIASLDAGVSVNSIEGTVMKNDYAILKTSAVYKGKFLPSESKKIRQNDIKRAKLNPTANSLIISRMNTPELVGECAYINSDYPNLFIPDRLWQTTLKRESTLNCHWLNYLLNTEKYRKIIKGLATGTSNSMKNISKQQLLSVRVPFPNKSEQKAIATALSDTDDLILSLEKLINKKKLIKQGAMQELLTGKKRIDGFSGEWEDTKLGKIADIATGNTPSTHDSKNYGDKYMFVSPVDLGMNKYILNTEKKLSEKGFNLSRKYPKGSILFTCIGSTIGKSGIALEALTSNQQINAIFPNDKYSTDFIFYMLKYLSPSIKSTASEQAVPIINKSTFENVELFIPKLEEQVTIAQILSDMDGEIEKLEIKLDKYKNIKKGMMEELLTGKRRLI